MAAPTSVEAYLAACEPDSRGALEHLREVIRAAAPDAVEAISYQMPAFRYRGRGLVAYAAFRDHCSLFPMSGKVMGDLRAELEPYLAGKGTLRFRVDDPIPDELVGRIVRAKIEEIESRRR